LHQLLLELIREKNEPLAVLHSPFAVEDLRRVAASVGRAASSFRIEYN